MTRHWLVALGVVLVACGGAPSAVREPASAAAAGWLVWIAEPGGVSTFELDAVGLGAARAGLWLSVDGNEVEIAIEEQPIAASRCELDDVVPDPTRTFTDRRLVARSGDEVRELFGWHGGSDGDEELEVRIEVLGSIGPRLAVRRFVHEWNSCGYGPLETTQLAWLDVRSGERLELPEPSPADEASARSVLQAAVRASPCLERSFAQFTADREPGDPRSAERAFVDTLLIRLGGPIAHVEHGQLGLAWHVFVYDYERTPLELTIPVTETPVELAAFVAPPDAVVRLLAAHPDATAVGWTER